MRRRPLIIILLLLLALAPLVAGCASSQPAGTLGCGSGDHVCVMTRAAQEAANAQYDWQRAQYATQGAAAWQTQQALNFQNALNQQMTMQAATPTAAALMTQSAISLAATGTVAAANSALVAAQMEATATRLAVVRAQEAFDATSTPLAATQAAATAQRYRFQADLGALVGALAVLVLGVAGLSFAAFAAVAAGVALLKGIWRLARRGRVIRNPDGSVNGVEYDDGVYHQPAKQIHATVNVYAGALPEPSPHAAQLQTTARAQAVEMARAVAGAVPPAQATRRESPFPAYLARYMQPQPTLPSLMLREVPADQVRAWLAEVEDQLLLPEGEGDA